ncbi:MAG: ATP-binding protein [Caulobacterales bacterium]|nr:ATP-binding protein [Caulobacterales bacterium]
MEAGDGLREARRQALGRTAFWFAAALITYLLVISILMPGWTVAKAAGVFAVLAFVAIAAATRFVSWYRPLALAFLATGFSTSFLAAMVNGGVTGYVAPFVVIGPLAAGYFLGARSAFVTAGCAIASLTALCVASALGWVRPTPYPAEVVELGSLIVLALTTVFGSIAVAAFSRQATRAIETQTATLVALSESDLRFSLVAQGASVGLWDWVNIPGDEILWSDQFYALLGRRPGDPQGSHSAFLDLLHPDDHQKTIGAISEHFRNRTPYRIEYRLRHATLGYRWFLSSGQATWNAAGRATRMAGSIMDIHDLRTAQLEAQEANLAKSAFLATMSHEIRTPMNGVLGMAQVLARSELTERQRKMVGVITDSGTNLLRIINDILDLSKIESGHIELEETQFRFGEVIAGTAELFKGRAEDAGVTLHVDSSFAEAADGRDAFVGDLTRLRQILNNLVSNAIKFTPEGHVTVSADIAEHDDADHVTLIVRVRDTGIGIAPEQLSRVFEPFQQADASITRRFGGTGLGLAISRELAEVMGGRLTAQSTLGEGSTFQLAAPMRRAPAQPETAGDRDAEPADARTATPSALAPRRAGLRLLVADDHRQNREVIAALLSPLDAQVTLVCDGMQALDAWQRQPFDAILMDVRMPMMDGLSATRAIRRREKADGTRRTPIIAVTADVMPDHLAELDAADLDGVVSKPVCADDLYARIAEALGEAGADAERRDGTVTPRPSAAHG